MNAIKPDQRVDPKVYPKIYAIKSSGGTYNIYTNRLQKYALILEEQLEYSFRTDGINIQFFEKQVQLPDHHTIILKTFFNEEFDGVFGIKDTGFLVIYIDGETFLQNTNLQSQWFECSHGGGCQAEVFITILNGKILYRFINHSNKFAHNHSGTKAMFNEERNLSSMFKLFERLKEPKI